MKIVIEIPDGCYKELCNTTFPVQDAYRLVAWITNGTPLPEHHGKLKELKAYKEQNDDAISRQAAISAIMGEYPDAHYPSYYKSKIDELPSVAPQPKMGQWILTDYFECSCCHSYSLEEGNYCPFCGAKMKEVM